MMGQQASDQGRFFYAFDLEEMVPASHLLRGIDAFLDLSDLRQHLAPFYSHTGRPSIDPELMMRMLIVGYSFGIRSERRLCEEVRLNLAYRWFCRLGLEDAVPDHSSFSKNRLGRFRESGTLRHLFETVLRRCMAEGLVGGEGFAVDASIIKADANRQRGVPGSQEIDWSDPALATRPVREYLAALDEEADGAPPRKPPKNISLTDPQSRWTAARGGPAFYAYSANYLIDLDVGIIIDSETTPAHRTEEVEASRIMIERVADRFGLKPDRLAADTAYGTAPMLAWLVEKKEIEPHIPVWDKSSGKEGLFGRSDFTWEAGADRYLCPAGRSLQRNRRKFKKKRDGVTKANTIIYRASNHDCMICPLKPRCCPNTPSRKIARSIHEDARDHARSLRDTPAYLQSRHDRKKVEMSFAHLKRILKLDRLRLRGMSGANDELLLAATAQNLRKMAKLIWRPPRNGGIAVPA
jgi:transposase